MSGKKIILPFKIDKFNIDVEVKNIGDLIKMCNDYKLAENVEYNIDMKSLHKIKLDLIELDNMIGMKLLKENIVDQILYYLFFFIRFNSFKCCVDKKMLFDGQPFKNSNKLRTISNHFPCFFESLYWSYIMSEYAHTSVWRK